MSCFRFIRAEKANHAISLICRVLGVSRSGYYAWTRRPICERELSDRRLVVQIRRIWRARRRAYGSPRIHAQLRWEGIRVSRKRVERVMRAHGIRGAVRRRYRGTTVRVAGVRPAPDLVGRNFTARRPNQLWFADMREIGTAEGVLHLAVVLDCFSRAIVGWSMEPHKRACLVGAALEMAVARRRPRAGLIHHSDQGSQPGLKRSSQQGVRAADSTNNCRRGGSPVGRAGAATVASVPASPVIGV